MLMRSAEFPGGACAFIHELSSEWHRWVQEGCATGRASCDNGSHSSDESRHVTPDDNMLGSGDDGYAVGADGKRIV